MDLPDKTATTAPAAKKEIKPVIPGAKKVSRPATRRFADFLFAESPKQLALRIGSNIIVPRIKAGFEEAVNNFLSGMLWGEGGHGRPASNIVQAPVIRAAGPNYNAISTQNSMTQAPRTASSGNYQDLAVPTQQYAETLLANMHDLLNQYRVVTVADLYELAGITTQPSDNAYGWTSLEGARIAIVREGYRLELPRPSLI